MTTERQIAANQENAKKSTGPRTESGKRRSRRNAWRHGLTAETLIDAFENAADYEALAKAIASDFRPATRFERELMARLVSLLWRLRRVTSIESGLLALQLRQHAADLDVFYRLLDPSHGHMATPKDKTGTGIARSFLKLASTDGEPFERLGRYETRLWRQLLQIVLLLNGIGRDAALNIDHRRRRSFRSSTTLLWPPVTPPI